MCQVPMLALDQTTRKPLSRWLVADTSQGAHVLLRTTVDKDSDAEQKLERPASWGSNTWRQSSMISRCSQTLRHEDP